MKHTRRQFFNVRSPCTWLLTIVFLAASGSILAAKGGKNDPDTGVVVYSDLGLAGDGLFSDEYQYPDRDDNPYCHGIDGYVYLVTRFTHGTGSQNRHDRTLWVHPNCPEGTCFNHTGDFEVYFLGTHKKAEKNGDPFGDGNRELVLRDMNLSEGNDLWRATFNIDLGKKRWLLYGYHGFADMAMHCGYPEGSLEGPPWTSSAPVWVRCEADDGPAGEKSCVEWTISTYDLRNPPQSNEPVLGCMIKYEKGKASVKHQDVEANFTIQVKYLEDKATCPPPDWPPID